MFKGDAAKAALLAAALLAACTAPDRQAPPAAEAGLSGGPVVATEAQNGGVVRVAPGARLLVSLPANGTTGYAWVVERSPWGLRLLSDDYAAAPSPDGDGPVPAGGEGRQTLVFQAAAAGAGDLRLAYRQPWSGGDVGGAYVLRVVSGR